MATNEFRTQEAAKGRAWSDLLGGVRDALEIWPPDYLRSIFGPYRDWIPPHRWFSEYNLAEDWRFLRAAAYLADVLVPSVPMQPPPFVPPLVQRLFWHPTRVLHRPDHIASYTSHLDESWLFINGILTDDVVAQRNAAYLSYLFHRPVTLIQNSTGGMLEDLFECARDKATHRMTEAATKAFPPLYDALKDPTKKRVVLVAHSQGTIVTAALLWFMKGLLPDPAVRLHTEPPPREAERLRATEWEDVPLDSGKLDRSDFDQLTVEEVGKLEIYAFGNCATSMRYLIEERQLPWIESFGNEYDIVARLGVLAPHQHEWDVHIDGPRYLRRGAWGHLLNEHYLAPIAEVQKPGRRRGPAVDSPYPYELVKPYPRGVSKPPLPRLYYYLNGGTADSTKCESANSRDVA